MQAYSLNAHLFIICTIEARHRTKNKHLNDKKGSLSAR